MIVRLLAALPKARRWVDQQVSTHWATSTPVSNFEFERLRLFFPPSLLERTRVAVVDQTPAPPLEQWGVGEFKDLGAPLGKNAAGITLGDLFFVRRGRQESESLFFHELVHVVQWSRLGANGFLALYGLLLRRYGYQESPLETMAYELQAKFGDRSAGAFDVVPIVQRRTDELVAGLSSESVGHRVVMAGLSVFRTLRTGSA